jgi:large subunit ribosomal protein L25
MKSVSLTAHPRTLTRRAGTRDVRKTGRIPAVIYGRQAKPQNLEVDAKELGDLMHRAASENLLVDLSVPTDPRPQRLAMLQDLQHHPMSRKVLHVDFHEVAETETVTIMVPVETSGEAAGVKNEGGVLEHVLFKLKVCALPKDLPEVITVDVTSLAMGKSVHIGDIVPPPGVEILGLKKIVVISCAAPRAEEVVVAAADVAVSAADVEMLKEKKEGEEGDTPAKPGDKATAAAKPGDKAAAAKPGDKAAAAAPKAGEKAPAEKKATEKKK